MSDETRVDRDALRQGLAANWSTEDGGLYGKGGAWYGWGAIADAVLALIPAPHPQGGRKTLWARIEALCDKAERHAWQEDDRWVSERALRALLAAAPAPTEAGGE